MTVVGMSQGPLTLDKTLFTDAHHSILIPRNIVSPILHLLNNVGIATWEVLRVFMEYFRI